MECGNEYDGDQDDDEVEVDDTIEEPKKCFPWKKSLMFVPGNGNLIQYPAGHDLTHMCMAEEAVHLC